MFQSFSVTFVTCNEMPLFFPLLSWKTAAFLFQLYEMLSHFTQILIFYIFWSVWRRELNFPSLKTRARFLFWLNFHFFENADQNFLLWRLIKASKKEVVSYSDYFTFLLFFYLCKKDRLSVFFFRTFQTKTSSNSELKWIVPHRSKLFLFSNHQFKKIIFDSIFHPKKKFYIAGFHVQSTTWKKEVFDNFLKSHEWRLVWRFKEPQMTTDNLLMLNLQISSTTSCSRQKK